MIIPLLVVIFISRLANTTVSLFFFVVVLPIWALPASSSIAISPFSARILPSIVKLPLSMFIITLPLVDVTEPAIPIFPSPTVIFILLLALTSAFPTTFISSESATMLRPAVICPTISIVFAALSFTILAAFKVAVVSSEVVFVSSEVFFKFPLSAK